MCFYSYAVKEYGEETSWLESVMFFPLAGLQHKDDEQIHDCLVDSSSKLCDEPSNLLENICSTGLIFYTPILVKSK